VTRALATGLQVRPVAADDRFAADGRVRHLAAYDAGRPGAPRPADGPGADLVTADVEAVMAALPRRLDAVLPGHPDTRRVLLRQIRTLLRWLQRFPGADWEQRWLASGVDGAPRSWTKRVADDAPGSPALFSQALAMLLLARVLRPSYSFLLNVKFGELFKRFPLVHDREDFARLRELVPYRRAVTRAQIDAEAGLIRVSTLTAAARSTVSRFLGWGQRRLAGLPALADHAGLSGARLVVFDAHRGLVAAPEPVAAVLGRPDDPKRAAIYPAPGKKLVVRIHDGTIRRLYLVGPTGKVLDSCT
jgi:hypothetical protein